MLSRITLFFFFLLAVNNTIYSQGLIQPDNLLKRSYSGFDEWCIQAHEYPGGSSYLFPVKHNKPFSNHSVYSSLVKSDGSGNITAYFSTPHDSANYSYSAQSVAVLDNEVVLIVGFDTVQTIQNEITNIGVLYYVLDSASLTYKYSDTLFNPFPNTVILGGAYTLKQPYNGINYGIQLVRNLAGSGPIISSYTYKLYKDGQGKLNVKYASHDSLLGIGGLTQDFSSLDIKMNDTKDSLFIYKVVDENPPFQKYNKIVWSMDTSLQHVVRYDVGNDTIHTPNGSILEAPLLDDILYINNDAFIQGPHSRDLTISTSVSYQVNSLIKFSKQAGKYVKALILPDTSNSSDYKHPSWFNSLDMRNGVVYSANFESIPVGGGTTTIAATSNYIYVGKTDTSLNAWHWYRYIRSPHVYLFPQYVLATADGGCMITAGAYDYINNPNKAHEFIVIKLDAQGTVTSISGPKNPERKDWVSVYPIPAQQELFIDYKGDGKYDLYIVDMSGKLLKNYKSLDKSVKSVSVRDLPVGAYLCRFATQGGEQQVLKFIKE